MLSMKIVLFSTQLNLLNEYYNKKHFYLSNANLISVKFFRDSRLVTDMKGLNSCFAKTPMVQQF